MAVRKMKFLLFAVALLVVGHASAFRNCSIADSDAWSAETHYTVSELAFDDITGTASGTETIYNYSNAYPTGGECHVTYELSGSYVPGVEVFVLNATRSNYSDTCPDSVLRIQYPATRLQTLQVDHGADGAAVVSSGDSGEFLADGSWQRGKAVYKTGEECSLF